MKNDFISLIGLDSPFTSHLTPDSFPFSLSPVAPTEETLGGANEFSIDQTYFPQETQPFRDNNRVRFGSYRRSTTPVSFNRILAQ